MAGEIVHALNGVSIGFTKGEYIAIMGTSGSGKSTFMNILGCLDKPTEGSYKLNGIDAKDLGDDDIAEIRNKEIGFVFQTFNLLPHYTAWENVALPLYYCGVKKLDRKDRARIALKMVDLENRLSHKPNELSGGQRQRVAIARALVNNPSLILADEPTGNLDSRTTDEILELFQKINDQGNTIIMVTHENEVAERTKRIVELKDGQIINDRHLNQ